MSIVVRPMVWQLVRRSPQLTGAKSYPQKFEHEFLLVFFANERRHGVPVIEIPTPEEAAAYAEKLAEVVADFAALGHGARLQAGLALGIGPSTVSGILNMRGVDLEILDRLGTWAKEEKQRRGL